MPDATFIVLQVAADTKPGRSKESCEGHEDDHISSDFQFSHRGRVNEELQFRRHIGRPRKSSAAVPLRPVLRLRRRHCLPLHVARCVCSAALQSTHVVHHVAGAAAGCPACGRAGMLAHEYVPLSPATLERSAEVNYPTLVQLVEGPSFNSCVPASFAAIPTRVHRFPRIVTPFPEK